MPRRIRTLIGTVVIIVFVVVYALVAMTVADSRIAEAPKLVQTVAYMLLGIAWVIPLLPLVKWMEGGKLPAASPDVEPPPPVPGQERHARQQ